MSKRFFGSNANKLLKETDPELHGLLLKEINRQKTSIDLIASENFPSNSVYQVLGSPLQNKYSEVS